MYSIYCVVSLKRKYSPSEILVRNSFLDFIWERQSKVLLKPWEMMSFSQTPVPVSQLRMWGSSIYTYSCFIYNHFHRGGRYSGASENNGLNLFCLAAWLYQLLHRGSSANMPDLYIVLLKAPRETPRQNSIYRMSQLILSCEGQVL